MDVKGIAKAMRDAERERIESSQSGRIRLGSSFQGSLRRMASKGLMTRKSSGTKQNEHGEAVDEDLWEVHPVQDKYGDICSLDIVIRLCQTCIRQVSGIPFYKKRKISGLREVQSSLEQLNGKIEAEQRLLGRFQDRKELQQSLLTLQDTLRLLSRKFHSVSKRKYFLDAAYGKRILILHQALNSSMNELFLCLSRQIWNDSMTEKRSSFGSVQSTWRSNRMISSFDDDDLAHDEQEDRADDGESKMGDSDDYDYTEDESEGGTPRRLEEVDNNNKKKHDQENEFEKSDDERIELRNRQGEEEEQKEDISRNTMVPETDAGMPVFGAVDTVESSNLYNLGRLHLFKHGNGGSDADNRKAVMYFSRAAQLGSTQAMILLGQIYEKGYGCDVPDLSLARHFLTNAANMDDTSGMTELALFNLRNVNQICSRDDAAGKAKFITAAIELLRKASKRGNPEAMCTLGEYYLDGKAEYDIKQNTEKAKALFAAAARAEHPRAQNNLGVLLIKDPTSRKEGVALLEISAEKGYAKAQNNLGMFFEGILLPGSDGSKTNANLPLAMDLYRKAADQGVPLAMHNLAYANMQLARQFVGTEKGNQLLEKAVELLCCSAAKGIVDSHYYLGTLFETGQGVSSGKNLDLAMYHLKLVASANKSPLYYKASLRLADLYYKKCQFKQAFKLYERCAQGNNCPFALNALGLLHETGKNKHGEPDFITASCFYEKAYHLGNANAAFNLALLKLEGKGQIKQDKNKAISLLRYASKHGNHKAAITMLSKLE